MMDNDRVTEKVPDQGFYCTVFRDGSGGYFSTQGTAETATPLLSLEPDDERRALCRDFYEKMQDAVPTGGVR